MSLTKQQLRNNDIFSFNQVVSLSGNGTKSYALVLPESPANYVYAINSLSVSCKDGIVLMAVRRGVADLVTASTVLHGLKQLSLLHPDNTPAYVAEDPIYPESPGQIVTEIHVGAGVGKGGNNAISLGDISIGTALAPMILVAGSVLIVDFVESDGNDVDLSLNILIEHTALPTDQVLTEVLLNARIEDSVIDFGTFEDAGNLGISPRLANSSLVHDGGNGVIVGVLGSGGGWVSDDTPFFASGRTFRITATLTAIDYLGGLKMRFAGNEVVFATALSTSPTDFSIDLVSLGQGWAVEMFRSGTETGEFLMDNLTIEMLP